MNLTSSAFAANQLIPAQYTGDGQDINPPLEINEVPNQAKSLVLIVDDPDASTGNWIHWLVWNISPETTEILKNSVPAGSIEGVTSFGKPGYGGPCPPSGTHRYFFRLYALNTLLDLPTNTNLNQLQSAMKTHIMAQAELMGTYERQ